MRRKLLWCLAIGFALQAAVWLLVAFSDNTAHPFQSCAEAREAGASLPAYCRRPGLERHPRHRRRWFRMLIQGFLLGLAAGLVIAGWQVQRLNRRWYRLARSNAKEIVDAYGEVMRQVADYIPDPEMSAALKRHADKAPEVWL